MARKRISKNVYARRGYDYSPAGPIPAIRITHHRTEILSYRPDNTIELNTNGWLTVTTKRWMNALLPSGVRIWSELGNWYVACGWRTEEFLTRYRTRDPYIKGTDGHYHSVPLKERPMEYVRRTGAFPKVIVPFYDGMILTLKDGEYLPLDDYSETEQPPIMENPALLERWERYERRMLSGHINYTKVCGACIATGLAGIEDTTHLLDHLMFFEAPSQLIEAAMREYGYRDYKVYHRGSHMMSHTISKALKQYFFTHLGG